MIREAIPQPQTTSSERRELPAHWFPKPELPTRDKDLLPLLRDEPAYEQARAEYGRAQGSWMDLRSEKSREDFFRRIRTPQHLSAFVKETQEKNHNLLKIFQLSAIGQCISASLASRARGGERSRLPIFSMLREAYRGQSIGRLSGHVGEAMAGQLIQRSGWEARYPSPVLDALLDFDRVAYHRATRSWRIIQCKADSRLTVPFAVAGEDDLGRLERALGAHFEKSAGEEAHQDDPRRRASPEETMRHWKKSLQQLASTCAILEKQYPGNTVLPMLVAIAGIGSKPYEASADPATGLLRDEFRGSIDFENGKAILPGK